MGIKIYKPYTATTRNRSVLDFSILSKKSQKNHLSYLITAQKGEIIKDELQLVIKEVDIKNNTD